jgi:phenylalanyl-tRNA synthetase alpha chain
MDLSKIEKQVTSEVSCALTKEALFSVEVKYLGRKGILTEALKSISGLPVEKRKAFGAEANRLKDIIQTKIKERLSEILNTKSNKTIDISAPGTKYPEGHLHP